MKDSRAPELAGWQRRTLSLVVVFAAAKIAVVALRTADGGGRALASGFLPLAMLYDDVAPALLFALLDRAVTGPAGDRPRAERAMVAAYWAVVAYTAFNVPVARVLSTPLTYPLITAAGGALADSIALYVTLANVVAMGGVLVVGSLVPGRAATLLPSRPLAVALFLLWPLGHQAVKRVETQGLHRNAVATIVRSSVARMRTPSAARTASDPLFAVEGPSLDLAHLGGAARGRNVLWIILESTGAGYLAPYGNPRDTTPNVTALAQRSLVYSGIYAAYPESIKGFFSTMCAQYPAPHTSAKAHGESSVRCESIATRMSAAGYDTALFHSGRFVYLSMSDVLADRGFGVLADAGDVGGEFASSFGTDDLSTAKALLAHLDKVPQGKPFFAVYMPISGHHPYRSPGKGTRPFPARTEREEYDNDLFAGDEATGALLDGLRARGLWERTAIIVNGDHGEAFQQHEGNFAHSLFLFEENVHVPLLVAAPGIVSQAITVPQMGSLIDVAPTILDLVGVPAPQVWQGRSLLRGGARVAPFYTDHTLFQLGLREGPWKFIHEVDSGRSRLFLIGKDPGEMHNLADGEPARVARYREYLLGWSDTQRARIRAGR